MHGKARYLCGHAALETVQETLARLRYMLKTLRVWRFDWVPAFAGTTDIGFVAQSLA